MARYGLKKEELDALIDNYRSELKKLRFQARTVRNALAELEAYKDGKDLPETAKADKKQKPAKRGRKPKITRKRSLSAWDEWFLNTLREEDRLMKRAELEERLLAENTEFSKGMPLSKISIKISNVLQKMTNTKGLMSKWPANSKRGYYGLNDWFFNTTGEPKSKYAPQEETKPKGKPGPKPKAEKAETAKPAAKAKPGPKPKAAKATTAKKSTAAKKATATKATAKKSTPAKKATATKAATKKKTTAKKTTTKRKTAAKK